MIKLRVTQVSRRAHEEAPGGFVESVHLEAPDQSLHAPVAEVLLVLHGRDCGSLALGRTYEMTLKEVP